MPELTNENKEQLNKKSKLEVDKESKNIKENNKSASKAKTSSSKNKEAISDKTANTKKAKTSTTAKKTNSSKSEKAKSTEDLKDSKENLASKAVKDAKEKVANEVKESLKQEVTEKKLSSNKSSKEDKKEESIIQKIKNFISKIVAMQEEARREAEEKNRLENHDKDLTNGKVDKNSKEQKDKKTKYMLEYYDLPYRYNETVVKILAQTPKRLFVYWDVSDKDIEKYKEAFGDYFFEDTYPVLLVHNEEKNYTFEVPINDFANSWYLDINDPKTKYTIQLGRKFKFKPEYVNIASTENTKDVRIYNDYVPITTSNILEVPNDHILFENIESKALYRNVKTNEESYINIANSEFLNRMGKIYNIYDLYKEIYKNELGEGSLTDLLNPSSMSSSGVNSSMFR